MRIFVISIAGSVVLLWGAIIAYLFVYKDGDLNKNYSIQQLGSVGDVFNIVTSLTGVCTVVLLVFSVIYQRRELTLVKEQINDQIESAKKEQRKNRTLKKIEEWDGAVIRDRDTLNSLLKSKGFYKKDRAQQNEDKYILFLQSHRWVFLQKLEMSAKNNSVYLSYMHFNELKKYIAMDYISELNKGERASLDGIKELLKDEPSVAWENRLEFFESFHQFRQLHISIREKYYFLNNEDKEYCEIAKEVDELLLEEGLTAPSFFPQE